MTTFDSQARYKFGLSLLGKDECVYRQGERCTSEVGCEGLERRAPSKGQQANRNMSMTLAAA